MNAAHALAIVQAPETDLAAPLSFSVPLADLGDFTALPETRRMEVQVYLRLLERVHALRGPDRSLQQACATVAAASRHLMRGCSTVSLRRKYVVYLAGGWRSLVAGYKGPSELPEAFADYVRKLVEENQRSMGKAFEVIHDLWRAGHPIPGYGTWVEYHMRRYPDRPLPKVCPRQLPAGWSCRNLYRKAPNKGARMLALRGLAAAKRYFPSIPRDPSQLRPLEQIVIDDFELDCLCVFPGNERHKPQIGRVAGLLAMDVATRRKLHWGIGQRLEKHEEQPDGTMKTVRMGITRVDVQLLLHGLFAEYGLPEYPVTILCENAAARISPELELALSTLFEGRVRVERTGLIDHKTLGNGFCEGGGKPWEKGWIESAFNALWNRLGNMPGYKGSNQRLNAPGDLDAKIAYTKLLLGQGERGLNLPPEKIMLLRLPFPSPQAVGQAFAWACAASDNNPVHRYLGFDRVTEYQIEAGADPVPFQHLALLPESAQQLATPVERMETSLERWQKLAAPVVFRPIPPAVLSLLLLTPKKVTYRNHAVTFTHDRTGYSYVDIAGNVLRDIQDGTEFLGYVDLKAPAELHLADLRGAYVGTLTRLGGARGMVDLRDKAAIKEAAAATATVFNRTLAEVRERHADQDAQLDQDRAHNAAIVEQHKAETSGLSQAERIALAAGENAARTYEEKRAAKDAARAAERDDAQLVARAAQISTADAAALLGSPAPAGEEDAAPPADHSGVSISDFLKPTQ
jgi:hypothetical protein